MSDASDFMRHSVGALARPLLGWGVSRLEAARRALLLAALSVPVLAPIVRRRDSRVLARSVVGIAAAFVASILAPGALYVLSPLVLGAAHIGADIRYLVRRQKMPPAVEAFLYGGCAAVLALRAAEMAAPLALPYSRIELATAAGWVLGASLLAVRGPAAHARAAAIALGAAGALAVAWNRPNGARIVFAHAHNAVALLVWLAIFFRRRCAAVPMAILTGAVLLIASGSTLPYVLRLGGHDPFRSHWIDAAALLAPFVPVRLGGSIVLSYVFLQSVHYMVWLVWIPDCAARAQGTPTFRMTAQGLRRDLGGIGLALVAVAALLVVVAAFFDAVRARAAYLSLSGFHGYLELAVLAFLTTRASSSRAGPPPRLPPSPSASPWCPSGFEPSP